MAKGLMGGKRALIDRANTTVVIMAGAAAFIFVFCLIATKTLVSQSNYQNRVITAKRQTLNQLKADKSAANQLESSFKTFTSTPQNAIGGSPDGVGPQDGDNAKIVLDALPSTYDFPALVNSLEALLNGQQVKVQSITGSDDEVAQSSNQSSATPKPVPMPFQLAVTGNYDAIKGLVSALERSIRPVQVQTFQLSASENNQLTLTLGAQTFYQPAKSLNITTKVVK